MNMKKLLCISLVLTNSLAFGMEPDGAQRAAPSLRDLMARREAAELLADQSLNNFIFEDSNFQNL